MVNVSILTLDFQKGSLNYPIAQDSNQVTESAEGVTSLRIGKDLFVKADPDSNLASPTYAKPQVQSVVGDELLSDGFTSASLQKRLVESFILHDYNNDRKANPDLARYYFNTTLEQDSSAWSFVINNAVSDVTNVMNLSDPVFKEITKYVPGNPIPEETSTIDPILYRQQLEELAQFEYNKFQDFKQTHQEEWQQIVNDDFNKRGKAFAQEFIAAMDEEMRKDPQSTSLDSLSHRDIITLHDVFANNIASYDHNIKSEEDGLAIKRLGVEIYLDQAPVSPLLKQTITESANRYLDARLEKSRLADKVFEYTGQLYFTKHDMDGQSREWVEYIGELSDPSQSDRERKIQEFAETGAKSNADTEEDKNVIATMISAIDPNDFDTGAKNLMVEANKLEKQSLTNIHANFRYASLKYQWNNMITSIMSSNDNFKRWLL